MNAKAMTRARREAPVSGLTTAEAAARLKRYGPAFGSGCTASSGRRAPGC
jgi:hypothetical protein